MGTVKLADLVAQRLSELMETDKELGHTKSARVGTLEGMAYIRFQPLFNRADLADLEAFDERDEPRLMVEIVDAMSNRPVEVVRVETVSLPGTVVRLSKHAVDGRESVVKCAFHDNHQGELDIIAACMNGNGCCITVEFARK